MSIDWFTFAAQLLNFILLVWLLKRFLYKPILDAIAARENRISAELANATAVETEAKRQRDQFQRSNEELEQQRAALLAEARQKAQAEYERLVAEARKTSEAVGRKRMQALHNNVENLNQAIGRRVQQEVFGMTRKILLELASESLEERMTATFISRLQASDDDSRKRLRAIVGDVEHALLLRSAFELPQRQRDAIQAALKDISGAEIEPRFETQPDLVSGIELIADGHKLAWSISDYLATLEKSVSEIMPLKDTEQRSARNADLREQQDS